MKKIFILFVLAFWTVLSSNSLSDNKKEISVKNQIKALGVFVEPLDYVAPVKIQNRLENNCVKPTPIKENTKINVDNLSTNTFRKTNNNTFVAFSGIGRKLGSE